MHQSQASCDAGAYRRHFGASERHDTPKFFARRYAAESDTYVTIVTPCGAGERDRKVMLCDGGHALATSPKYL
ncbi:hypothetical protein V7x_55300 [Crateriforma conspicua]|uniref:Uncharacterized protein n=1 Tax=Crateriforma conspicua TaxID=2527996 RepID=A0A5C6FDT3_9PLAN|nr:hypothetical protein V7x_55300 [Crateriforma conspicua]